MAISKKEDLIAVFIPPQKHDFCFEKLVFKSSDSQYKFISIQILI